MGRTRLRGIELAGLRLAVESPQDFVWDWATGGLAELSCAADEPDIHVGVSCGDIMPPKWDPITYSFEGGSFDVAMVDEEWWVGVHSRGRRFERLVRFNKSFTQGDVVIAPGAEETLSHPLDGPLLDWLMTHAVIERGGLVLCGSAILDSGSALAVLSVGSHSMNVSSGGESWDGCTPILTPGSRFAVYPSEDGFRVHALPGADFEAGLTLQGRLKAIHVLDTTTQAGIELLESEDAMEAVLSRTCAPVHAPDLANKILTTASRVADRIPMARLGIPRQNTKSPFVWGGRETALGFAMPALG